MSKLVIKRKNATKGFYKRATGLADKVKSVQTEHNKLPAFRAGDTVKVFVKIKEGDKERIQAYEGVVMRIKNDTGNRTFTVRKISHGVGVERIFSFQSTKIASVELVQAGRVRRAKLYYLRGREGRAAKIERDVETQAQHAQIAASEAARAKAAKSTT